MICEHARLASGQTTLPRELMAIVEAHVFGLLCVPFMREVFLNTFLPLFFIWSEAGFAANGEKYIVMFGVTMLAAMYSRLLYPGECWQHVALPGVDPFVSELTFKNLGRHAAVAMMFQQATLASEQESSFQLITASQYQIRWLYVLMI